MKIYLHIISHFCSRVALRFCLVLILFLFLTSAESFCFNKEKSDTTTFPAKDPAVIRLFPELNVNSFTEYDPISPFLVVPDSVEEQRTRAMELNDEVTSDNRFIASLNELSHLKLPVGLQKQIGPLTYTIVISAMEATPTGALLEAYLMLEIPSTGDKIAFRGSKIPFSNKNGFAGTGRLELIGNYPITLNESTLLTIRGKGETFAEFDCEGFSGIQLDAVIEFSRQFIIPENASGKQIGSPVRVKTNIKSRIRNWNDILLSVTLPPFQINGLKDVSFEIQEAMLDWSDLMNPSGIQFPKSYTSSFLTEGNQTLWQGIYIKHLAVKLPRAFAKKGSAERVSIGVENMIIDDRGLTGDVFAQNVLDAGDMNGWGFTVDKVAIALERNDIMGFEVAGKISVPGLKNAQKGAAAVFNYKAHKGASGDYIFVASISNQVELPLLYADLNLLAGSTITVVEKDDKFFPTALLSGSLTINAAKTAFNGISFEGLRISTEEPRFDIQTVGFSNAGNQKVSDFPVVINSILVQREPGKLGVGFDLAVNIGGNPQEGGFSANGKVTVWGKEVVELYQNGESTSTNSKWEFDRVEIGKLALHATKPEAYDLHGEIIFFDNNAVYGKGFQGSIDGKLGKIGPIKVNVLFGKTSSFRYWYADALIKLPTRLPVIPSVMFANAFGGGFYYKMRQTDQAPQGGVGSFSQSPNETPTTVHYVPDENSFGIKGIMGIESVRKEAMNGTVMLELMMNRYGGINMISLSGNADFMFLADLGTDAIKGLAGGAASGQLAGKLGSLPRGQVNGNVRLTFDNVNDVFHGNMEIFINVAGGLLKGVGANDRAGWAVLHFEKNDWYIHIGTPSDPIGLEVAKIFQATSYLMLGKNLPGSPAPPQQVTEILGDVDLDYMRDMNALQSGAGFAFGLHFVMDTGDLNFLMFYARFAAGTGVDFMLKDYGTAYHCQGSNGPMGINGWYANGQAYAFVMGKVGIKVNLKFYKGNFDILNIGAAAVLQMKGPNPFWMKGTVGGYYSILGGMVKGNCRFEVEVGEKCIPVGEQNALADQQLIAEISPADNATKVDVFTNPQVAFNIPIGEIFHITDLQNTTRFFRGKLEQFTVADGTQLLEGIQQWNEDKNVVIFDGHEILPGEKKLTVNVKLKFEERINGVWQTVIFQGAPVEENRSISFTTDKAPDYIPGHNVSYSYPLQDQRNFHPLEYNKGLIQLKDGQSYLFMPNAKWTQRVRMTKADGSGFIESALTYNSSLKRVMFDMPTGFQSSQLYNFEVLNVPVSVIAMDSNVKGVEKQLQSEEGTAVLTTKDIEGQLERLEVKSLYSAGLRTSKYNTFQQKVQAIQVGGAAAIWQWLFVSFPQAWVNGDEGFSAQDLTGSNSFAPLVTFEADLSNTEWYQTYVGPKMYDSYPYLSVLMVNRSNALTMGIPPIRDVTIEQVSSAVSPQPGLTAAPVPFNKHYISYNIMRQVEADYYHMQNKAGNYLLDHPGTTDSRLSSFLTLPPPYIRFGYYPTTLKYKPPGVDQHTSSFTWNLFNGVK